MIERADSSPDPSPVHDESVAQAIETVAALHQEADALRADLALLREDLAQVERDFDATPGEILREANGQLVLAAMRAEAIAQTATSHLSVLAKAGLTAGLAQAAGGSGAPAGAQGGGIDDLREANEQLVIAALNSQALEATALEAHHRQIAFLATVAHELRNPLMPLRLAALMLDRARTDDVAHARLQATISGQVAQMTRLIGDLLDGSRISTGKFRLERTPIELGTVIARVVETCQPAMDSRRQQFAFETTNGPVMMLGDSVRLVQVFSNLLENASKYTPEGGAISMRVAVTGKAVAVTIRDNGIGITAKALPHVFDMFVRDAHAAVLNHDGLGIGLAVVRELVKAHEGRVAAHSDGENRGSEFVVVLPVAVGMTRDAASS